MDEPAGREYLGISQGHIQAIRTKVAIGHGERNIDDYTKMSDDSTLDRSCITDDSFIFFGRKCFSVSVSLVVNATKRWISPPTFVCNQLINCTLETS